MTRRHHLAFPPVGPCSQPCWARLVPRRPAPSQAATYPITPQQREHRAEGGAGRRAAVRTGAERARLVHRQARRHAVGHLRPVPEEPVALARALGHEPRADPQPAPDLSRARCCSSRSPTGARGCAWAAAVGATGDRQAVAARALQRASASDVLASIPLQPDRAVPQRGGDLRDRRTRNARRASSRRRRAACCCRAATWPTCAASSGGQREYRIFREPRPLRDPTTSEMLGYEASFVGTAEYTVQGETRSQRRRQGRRSCRPPSSSPASARRPASATASRRCRRASSRNYAPHAPARADRRADRLDLRRSA